MKNTLIKKSSGGPVPFSTETLEQSLFRSGASPELIKKIIDSVPIAYFNLTGRGI